MILHIFIAMSLAVGWMLSPDVLVRLGHGIAENRTLYLAGLAAASLISALSVSIIRHPDLRYQGRCAQAALLIQGTGRIPAMTILLAARISLVLLIPTGLLVTAGTAFNEIFLYWFPNFSFSFILLGTICIIHLTGDRFARLAQLFFAIVVFLSLFILCIAGLGGSASSAPISVDIGFSFTGPVFTGTLLLFLGFDYITPEQQNDSRLPGFAALFFCLLLFLFWCMLSLQYAEAEQLSASSLPYMLVAKKILGESGRYLMGIVVISGVCGAVNSLFLLATGSLNELSTRHLLPGHPPTRLKRKRFVLLLTLLISIFLLSGLAGHVILETYIEGSLLLWGILIAMQCFAAGRLLGQLSNPMAWRGYLLATIYGLIVAYLAVTHTQATDLLRFLLLLLITSAGASGLWLWLKPVYEVSPPSLKDNRR